jgi:hypothetical protein
MAASTGLTPEERRQRSRLAAYKSWAATTDRTKRSQHGRDAFRKSFDDKVEREHPELDAAARSEMAEAAYKAHFAKMAFQRSKRRTKAQKMTNAGNGTRRSPKTGDVTSDVRSE